MNRPIVAIDIDDVLSASADKLVAYSNDRWGTRLVVDDYDEHWGKMWQIEHDEFELEKRAEEVHLSGIFGETNPKDDGNES